MKKILSPVVYAAFLALVFFLDTVVLAIIQMELEVQLAGTIFLLILFAAVSTLLFWLSNKLMSRLEKLNKPKIADHFRQSSVCYLAIVVILFEIIRIQAQTAFNPSSQLIKAVIIALAISIWAIVVNGIFLYTHREANIS